VMLFIYVSLLAGQIRVGILLVSGRPLTAIQ